MDTWANPILANGPKSRAFIRLAAACAVCKTEQQFRELIRRWVHPILPHGALAAVIGRIDLDHLRICRFVGVDYPEEALPGMLATFNLRERPALQRWFEILQPLVLSLPADAGCMSAKERREIELYGLGRLAIHGSMDLGARAGSYFYFARVPPHLPADDLAATLKLLVPPLHQALVALHRHTPSACGQSSTATALSPTERELLRWAAAGRTNAEIAALRGRSVATVRNQLHSAYAKLGVSSRTEATRLLHAME